MDETHGCRSGMDCPNIVTCKKHKATIKHLKSEYDRMLKIKNQEVIDKTEREMKDNNALRITAMKLFKKYLK